MDNDKQAQHAMLRKWRDDLDKAVEYLAAANDMPEKHGIRYYVRQASTHLEPAIRALTHELALLECGTEEEW